MLQTAGRKIEYYHPSIDALKVINSLIIELDISYNTDTPLLLTNEVEEL